MFLKLTYFILDKKDKQSMIAIDLKIRISEKQGLRKDQLFPKETPKLPKVNMKKAEEIKRYHMSKLNKKL